MVIDSKHALILEEVFINPSRNIKILFEIRRFLDVCDGIRMLMLPMVIDAHVMAI